MANFNGDSVSELTLASGYSTGFNFAPAGAALDQPVSLSMDRSGNLFVANQQGNSVSALRQSSGYSTGFKLAPAGAAFNQAQSTAIDGSGNLFVANVSGDSVSELIGLATPVTTPISQSAGGAGRAGAAIIMFLTLLTFWYGRKYRRARMKRAA